MVTKGGSGTLQPPGDDNVAPLIPLRQRHTEPSAPSTPRKALPRERAAFDPELEPGDVALRRRRRPRAAFGHVRQATTRLHVRPRPTATAAALVAVATAGVIAAGVLGPQVFNSAAARRAPTVAQHPAAQVDQTQMNDASADRTRHSLTRPTASTHRSRLTHRVRTRARTRRSAKVARQRSHHSSASTPQTRTAASSDVATGQPAASSDTQARSASSGAGSASGSTSASNRSTADQSSNLPPGPTGIGTANGCNPKCS